MFKIYTPDMDVTMLDGVTYSYEYLQKVPRFFPLTLLDTKWVLEGIEQDDSFLCMDWHKFDDLLDMYDVDGDLKVSGLDDETILSLLEMHVEKDPITKYDLAMAITCLHKDIAEVKECVEKCMASVCMIHSDIEEDKKDW